METRKLTTAERLIENAHKAAEHFMDNGDMEYCLELMIGDVIDSEHRTLGGANLSQYFIDPPPQYDPRIYHSVVQAFFTKFLKLGGQGVPNWNFLIHYGILILTLSHNE